MGDFELWDRELFVLGCQEWVDIGWWTQEEMDELLDEYDREHEL